MVLVLLQCTRPDCNIFHTNDRIVCFFHDLRFRDALAPKASKLGIRVS